MQARGQVGGGPVDEGERLGGRGERQEEHHLAPGVGDVLLALQLGAIGLVTATTQIAVYGGGLSGPQLYDYAANNIAPLIEGITGVASASPNGGRERQINVVVDPVAAAARGLTSAEVGAVVAQALSRPARARLATMAADLRDMTSGPEAPSSLDDRRS